MNHHPLLSIIAESFDHMFVEDKRGKTIFFPWGSNKPGYFINNQNTVEKVKKFYRFSFWTCFVALGITLSFLHEFWAIIVSMVIFLGGWYLTSYLYTTNITKHLLPSKTSYKDVVLEKLETDDVEESNSTDIQYPKQWNDRIRLTKHDPFIGIKRFWYRLTPTQLFMLFISVGFFIMIFWVTYQPKAFGENQFDYLVASFASFLCGISGFVVSRDMQSSKTDIWGFLNWKLPWIFIMVFFWTLAVLSLYKFIVMMLVQ